MPHWKYTIISGIRQVTTFYLCSDAAHLWCYLLIFLQRTWERWCRQPQGQYLLSVLQSRVYWQILQRRSLAMIEVVVLPSAEWSTETAKWKSFYHYISIPSRVEIKERKKWGHITNLLIAHHWTFFSYSHDFYWFFIITYSTKYNYFLKKSLPNWIVQLCNYLNISKVPTSNNYVIRKYIF